MAQIKCEVIVPSTADDFRAAVSALLSLEGKNGVSFHNFTLPEDCCVRLLVKHFGMFMSERRQKRPKIPELLCPGSYAAAIGPSRQVPAKDRPLTHTPLYHCREGLMFRQFDSSPNSVACECRCSRTWLQKPTAMHALSSLQTHRVTADTHPGESRVELPTFRCMLYLAETASELWSRWKPHGELPWMCKFERSDVGLWKSRAPAWPKQRRNMPTCRTKT